MRMTNGQTRPTVSELIALSESEFADKYCVVVDHRAFETEVVNDFAAFLDEGDVLTAAGDEVPGRGGSSGKRPPN